MTLSIVLQKSNVERNVNRSGNDIVFYLIKKVESELVAQRKQIQTLQNRELLFSFEVEFDF